MKYEVELYVNRGNIEDILVNAVLDVHSFGGDEPPEFDVITCYVLENDEYPSPGTEIELTAAERLTAISLAFGQYVGYENDSRIDEYIEEEQSK